MEFNKDKVDEYTLALLFLVMYDEGEYGARAWKGFNWDTMNRLHEKGFIGNPVGKAKSVIMTKEGCKRARELFEAYFIITGDKALLEIQDYMAIKIVSPKDFLSSYK